MILRVLLLVVGLASASAGGVLGWLNRGELGALFPPAPGHTPWPLIAAVALLALGLVLLVAGLIPQQPSRKANAAKTAERDAKLKEADVYYAAQGAGAQHPADRDWRSADLPPAAPPRQPEPQPAPPLAPPPPSPQPVVAAPPPPPAPPPPAPPPPPPPAPPPSPPPPPAPATVSASAFPSAATLAPLPTAASAPPAPPPRPSQPPTSAPTPAPTPVPTAKGDPFARIRDALAAKQLAEADRLLGEERSRLSGAGDADPVALAELTGLAGDHAAADGRVGGAKWLWRLALQRFAKASAIDSPAARAVAERLRLADQ